MFTSARIKANRGKGADFYSQHLSNNDYYSEHEKIIGKWKGSLAADFGLLNKDVDTDIFLMFQQNINPVTKGKLTVRTRENSVRFYDFQCSAQKSVSIMSLFDERLIEAHRKAVDLGMLELEKLAAVRVRQGKAVSTKDCTFTGNFIYAQYHHDSSRMLDPQLHAHNVIVNVTKYDGEYKALETLEMCRAIRYAGKTYQNAMARACVELGYEIENKYDQKGRVTGFEIKGVSEEIMKRCSRRREQIDKAIEAFVSEHGRQPTFKEIDSLTLLTRNRKMYEKTDSEVFDLKMATFTEDEKNHFQSMADRAYHHGASVMPEPVSHFCAREQLQKVVGQLFERDGVLTMDKILAEVQNQNLGWTDLSVLKEEILHLPGLVSLDEPKANPYFTTEENLQREEFALSTVRERKNTFASRQSNFVPFSSKPDDFDHSAQVRVINDILSCKDQFMVLRGVAGAGKTSTLQELCKGLKTGGVVNIHVVAPTNSAVDVLRSEKFSSAQTVASFLQNSKHLPPDGSYLIIDESGLNSIREGTEMMKAALQHNYQLLFVGDIRQHSSVESGDFLRLLEEHSDIMKTSLTEIHRQQEKEYRDGIMMASEGKFGESFDHLTLSGFVHENKADYLEKAAESFIAMTNQGKTPLDCLAVAPTIRECELLTGMIRQKMKDAGQIQSDTERVYSSFSSYGWTKKKLEDIHNYQRGQQIFFTTRLRGFGEPGDMFEIRDIRDGQLVLSDGRTVEPASIAKAVDVGERIELPIAAGDMIRMTVNIKEQDVKINNGSLAIATGNPYEFELLDSSRSPVKRIKLRNGFAGFKHGWVMTSNASQGMTTKNVVVAAEKMTTKQFYVACSRGKRNMALHIPEIRNFRELLIKSKADRVSVSDLRQKGKIKTVPQVEPVDPTMNILGHLKKRFAARMKAGVQGLYRKLQQLAHLHKSKNKHTERKFENHGKTYDRRNHSEFSRSQGFGPGVDR